MAGKSDDEGSTSKDDPMDVDDENDYEKQDGAGGDKSADATSNPNDDEEEEEEDDDDGFEYKWLDHGRMKSGRREFESIILTMHGTSFKVSRNDYVLLWGNHGDDGQKDIMTQTIEEIWLSAGCAKVECMWEEVKPNSTKQPKPMFKARWFLRKDELASLFEPNEFTGKVSLTELQSRMFKREVVGSCETGIYSMSSIGGPARVFFRTAPTEEYWAAKKRDKNRDGHNKDDPHPEPELPKDAFMCRYNIRVIENSSVQTGGDNKGKSTMEVVPYPVEESEMMEERSDEEEESDRKSRKRRRDSDDEDESSDESSSGDDDNEAGGNRVVEGEGSITNQGQIRVGPQHQVPVPVFDANDRSKVVSRNPSLVWSPKKQPAQEQVDDYLQKAAAILTPFAEQQLLIMGTEPFVSIPSAKMRELIKERGAKTPLTVSSISTSSSLASAASKTTLLRECDADALLKNLHDNDYNVEAAISMVTASPRDFLAGWSIAERETFDASFRRYAGSLRMVAKSFTSLASTKSHCQVVDYHYRFKIPDQFRRFQDRKREQAVRMMECIEARKFKENPEVQVARDDLSGEKNAAEESKKKQEENWANSGTTDVTKAVDERRSAAKELLLEIQREMGKEKMAEVAGAIISLNQGSERESKEALLRILKNQPALHHRLVEFLPKRFWK